MNILITGGAGYIGQMIAKRLAKRDDVEGILLTDIREPDFEITEKLSFLKWDIRSAFPKEELPQQIDWIFNLAAIHREPGHAYQEYFNTNIPGAHNICDLAKRTGCKNIFFTSSIAVYGPVHEPTKETSPKYPSTGYGITKHAAELIHEGWQKGGENRRLITVRPGVVYGPGEQGNIRRMVDGIRKGFFAIPGSPKIKKSYAYIEGLLDAIEFLMARSEPVIRANYVENPTQTLGEIAGATATFLGKKSRTITLPKELLIPASKILNPILRGKGGIHPVRVKKACTPTNIIPQTLIDMGFPFERTFASSLEEWAKDAPEDFGR